MRRTASISLILLLTFSIIIVAFQPQSVEAAITVESTVESGDISFTSSGNFDLTVTAGNAVVVTLNANGAGHCSTDPAVTYNGVAMTKAVGTTGNNQYSAIWYVLNPAAGTHAVAWSCGAGSVAGEFGAASIVGTNTSDFVEDTETQTGSAQASSVSVTCAAACLIVDNLSGTGTFASTFTATAGRTRFVTTTAPNQEGGSSYENFGSGGTNNQTWSWNGGFNDTFMMTALAINADAGGPSDSCTYSGSGDWNIVGSDACKIGTTYVVGQCHFIGTGQADLTGSLSCAKVNIGVGFKINKNNSTGKLHLRS